MKYLIPAIVLSMFILTACSKQIDVDTLTAEDLYGAWVSYDDDEVTKYMLFYETNTIYPEASETNGIVIINSSDDTYYLAFSGSYDVRYAILVTDDGNGTYGNEIYEYTQKRMVIYSSTADNEERTYEKITTALYTERPTFSSK